MIESLSAQATAGLVAVGIALWFAASVAYRLAVGMPLFANPGPQATFAEGWASGRVGTGLFARLSTARNCLHVQVDQGTLRVHPHFPFTLGFLPEVYAMDQVVPLGRVRGATIMGGNRTKAVEVRFLLPTGQEETLQLLLGRAEQFVHAVLSNESTA